MALEKPRLARLTAIITQLQAGKTVTARQLAERHNVSLRTIYRDIRSLESSGVPVFTVEGKGYSLLDSYRLPPVAFTEDEAHALLTAATLLARNRDASLVRAHREAISKIIAVLPPASRSRGALLTDRMQARDTGRDEPSSDLLLLFQRAIVHHLPARCRYETHDGRRSERTVEPFGLYASQGNWIGVAYCRLREDYRAFRLDRFQDFRLLSEPFSPHDISLEDYFTAGREKYISTLDIPLSPGTDIFAVTTNNQQMKNVTVPTSHLIGITVRTSNADPVAASQAIGGLWQRLLAEQLIAQIPNKVDSTVYCVYTDYESDHTGAYTAALGCRVTSLKEIPAGMQGFTLPGGEFARFVCKGDLSKGVVYGAWQEIWAAELDRAFVADFEVYGPKALNPQDAEVEILVGLAP